MIALRQTERMGADGSNSDDARLWQVAARTPRGRNVVVLAVRRGLTLRNLSDGSGQLGGLLMEIGLKVGSFLFSRLRQGWTVGVVSVDIEPWLGQRVLYRERWNSGDPRDRIVELQRSVESGVLPIPQPRGASFKTKP
jgi:hypothetical protein